MRLNRALLPRVTAGACDKGFCLNRESLQDRGLFGSEPGRYPSGRYQSVQQKPY